MTWEAEAQNTPDWWLELAEISEVDDHWELARKIQASFKLSQWISKQHGMEHYHQAPSALPCLCQKDFLTQQDSKFPCQDIRESHFKKMVAHTQALQFWAEKANLPTLGQPCLLAGSVLELREVMKCYVSFPNDAIFGGVALLEGSPTNQPETTTPGSAQPVSTDSPIEEVAAEEVTLAEKAAMEEAAPIGKPPEVPSTSQTPSEGPTRKEHLPIQFPWWREVLHPSRPVTATRQVPLIPRESRWRPCSKSSRGRRAQHQWAEEQLQVQHTRSDPTSPIGLLETAWQVTPPLGFQGVTSCLWRDPLPVAAHEAPLDPLQLPAVVEPTVAMMSASCIVKDKATRITYMDTVTTSMGRVALGGPSQGTQTMGPLLKISLTSPKDWLMTAFGQKGRPMTTFGQKDWDAISWKPSHVLLFILVICHGGYLCLLIGQVHVPHLYVVTAISRYF